MSNLIGYPVKFITYDGMRVKFCQTHPIAYAVYVELEILVWNEVSRRSWLLLYLASDIRQMGEYTIASNYPGAAQKRT